MKFSKKVSCSLAVSAVFLAACQEPDSATSAASEAYPAPLALAIPIQVNGKMAVIDEKGSLLIPFENEYGTLFQADYQTTVWAVKEGKWQLIGKDGKNVLNPGISDYISKLTPGYFSFAENEKYGIVDVAGNIVQAAKYDSIYTGGDDEYIVYEIADKRGIMDAKGAPITEAVYDSSDVRSSLRNRNGLVTAERDGAYWVIDTQTGEQKQVPYDYISTDGFVEGVAVASIESKTYGLINSKGDVVIPLEYNAMRAPSEGLVFFRREYNSPCGYMDYQGKVVIEAKFAVCGPFGKKGAFAAEQNEEGGKRAFLIDRTGAHIAAPEYADATEPIGFSGPLRAKVSNIMTVARMQDGGWSADFGIFDTNEGVEVIAPSEKYNLIGALTPTLFFFSSPGAPELPGPLSPLPSVGVIDRSGKELIKLGQFSRIVPADEGSYLLASGNGMQALFDLNAKELIAQRWAKLEINRQLNVIFGYAALGMDDEGDPIYVLRAAYGLDGKPLFSVRETDCGAAQLLNGQGKVVWPQDVKPYCLE
ncbi:MAG: WG repeat-containing protein [Azoarcus sp.]|nr:WG repeat-containing protein [Azoarcus sp.]